jgi:hypothetical protein
LTLLPGVTTCACSPRGIQQQPMSGLRFRSTSSWNTAASSGGRPLSSSRIFRSFQRRRPSFGPSTGRGRRHTICWASRHRRTVSALAFTPCVSYSTNARVAQHQRLRQNPKSRGVNARTHQTRTNAQSTSSDATRRPRRSSNSASMPRRTKRFCQRSLVAMEQNSTRWISDQLYPSQSNKIRCARSRTSAGCSSFPR